jgi:[acyl-carrier-protein] S-malonyltransferase
MNKIAIIFPGQASHYIGMGKDFYEKYPIAKEIFDKANTILNYDLKKIIFEGPMDLLTQTKHTQPAVFIISIICFKVFSMKIDLSSINFCAGHSLGEYSALVASESINFEDGLKLVNKRAEFIQDACDKTKGSMLAVLGSEKNIVNELCAEAGKFGICETVNFNAPGQIIISGKISAIEKAKEIAKTRKIKTIPLAVSGAFHSSLMKDAQIKMSDEIKEYNFKNPKFPVVTNCDAEVTSNALNISEKLVKQIVSPVLWIDSINKIISKNCNIFVELGPKNIVSGMIKKISSATKTFNIENEETLNYTMEALKNV